MLRNTLPCLAIVLVFASPPAMAETAQLTGSEIQTEIIGATLKAKRMGMTATITHALDGTSALNAPVRKRSGTWQVVDDTLCVAWAAEADRECVSFHRQDEIDKFLIKPNGTVVTRVRD